MRPYLLISDLDMISRCSVNVMDPLTLVGIYANKEGFLEGYHGPVMVKSTCTRKGHFIEATTWENDDCAMKWARIMSDHRGDAPMA